MLISELRFKEMLSLFTEFFKPVSSLLLFLTQRKGKEHRRQTDVVKNLSA